MGFTGVRPHYHAHRDGFNIDARCLTSIPDGVVGSAEGRGVTSTVSVDMVVVGRGYLSSREPKWPGP